MINEEELFNKYEKLIWHVINKKLKGGKRFEKMGFYKEDLYQIGSIGLINSIRRFDESLGNAFSTFAIPYIYGSIMSYIRDKEYMVNIPRRAREIYSKVKHLDKVPTPKDIIAEFKCMRWIADIVIELFDISVISIDITINQGENETVIADVLADKNINVEEKALKNVEFEHRLNCLDDKEKTVIIFSLESKTQREIGSILGISQVQVSRIYKRALKKIQDEYGIAI